MSQQFSLLTSHDPAETGIQHDERSGAFVDNMKLPVHRWFRYSAGFSAAWAAKTIKEFAPKAILDPFAGSGTSLIAAEQCGVFACGFESHPFIVRIADAKLHWNAEIKNLINASRALIEYAKKNIPDCENVPALLLKCYTYETILKLYALKKAFYVICKDIDDDITSLLWIAITSILRECSHVGTAQWQYILPNKIKSKVSEPFFAFESKIYDIVRDMSLFQRARYRNDATILKHDARLDCERFFGQIDFVLTSPPYPNNYDYADATRLEMCFWGDIEKWADLHLAVRQYIIRSCSQHAAQDKLKLGELLTDSTVNAINDNLSEICHKLEMVRLQHGGKKAYHLMIAAYFIDLSRIFISLRRMCKTDSTVCFVIGDSAPYGVYVPVDELLGKLAVDAGFLSYSFEKIRDRNCKWKNRKHRVPLQEGRLWIKG
jgi:hypothetical protein